MTANCPAWHANWNAIIDIRHLSYYRELLFCVSVLMVEREPKTHAQEGSLQVRVVTTASANARRFWSGAQKGQSLGTM